MAVNDPVTFYAASLSTFQPASGVVILVLMAFSYSTAQLFWHETDGTNTASNYSKDLELI